MARKTGMYRKYNGLIIRNYSPCQWRYLKDLSEVESAKRNRHVGLSEITAKIILEAMRREGYICEN